MIIKTREPATTQATEAANDAIVGVLNNQPAAGDTASVVLRSGQGTIKVVAGGSISIGDCVTATTGGAVIATTSAGNEVVGRAGVDHVDDHVADGVGAFLHPDG